MSMEEVVQQSLFEEANRLETARIEDKKKNKNKVQTERERKTAFRVAFDFLESHMPPKNTEEYWMRTCADIGPVADANHDNLLCQELLIAVITYLEKAVDLNA